MTRIGPVCSSFLPATGGMEWKVHQLATEYSKRGHEVTVFAGRPRLTLRPIELPLTPTYEVVRCGVPLPKTSDSPGRESRRSISRSTRIWGNPQTSPSEIPPGIQFR